MAIGFTAPTTFTAVDKFSGTVNKMIGRTNKFERSMRNASRRSFEIARGAGAMGLAIVTPLALAVNEAVKFESAMADVAKVANVSIGSDSFKAISEDAKTLGVNLGISSIESAALMANIAQGGTAIEDLNKVSMIAGKVGVAFGISADLAGSSFIKTKNALGGTISETERLMDSINMLGNTTSASSEQILTFMSSGGSGVARAAGASGEALAAYGSQFISMGKSGEEAATIMERFIRTSLNSKSLRSVFDSVGGGAAGMNAIIQKGAKLSGTAQDKYFKQFGNYGLSIQLMAKNYDQLQDKIKDSTSATKTADSVLKEFSNRTSTSGFKMQQAKQKFVNVAITLGTALLPAITDVMKAVTPLIDRFSTWIKNNPELTSNILKTVAAIGALSLAGSGLGFVIGGVTKALSVLGGPVTLAIAAVGTLAAVMTNLNSVYNRTYKALEIGNSIRERTLMSTIDQRLEVNQLFKSLRNTVIGSEQYNKSLVKLEEIQPGVTKQFNLQNEKLRNLKGAYDSVTESILKQAQAQAALEIARENIKAAEVARIQGPGFIDNFLEVAQRAGLGGFAVKTAEDINNDRIAGFEENAQIAANNQDKVVNPNQNSLLGEMARSLKEKVEIIINNNSDSTVETKSGMAMATTTNTN